MSAIQPLYFEIGPQYDLTKWNVDVFKNDDNTMHVYPMFDSQPHDIQEWGTLGRFGPMCGCAPKLEEQPCGTVLVIHQMFDPSWTQHTKGHLT